MALGHEVSYRNTHPPAFRLLPLIDDDQKLPFPTAAPWPVRIALEYSWAGSPPHQWYSWCYPPLCIPSRDCIFIFFYPHNIPKPCGQPALPYVCSAQRGNPSLRLLPGHLSPALTMLGGISCVHGGIAVARYLHRCNCEGILHSSVPVSLIQHYCVLGKGVGANALPSPSFDHCVILFFYTNCV